MVIIDVVVTPDILHDMENKKSIFYGIVFVVVAIGAAVLLSVSENNKTGKYDAFATCLDENGATFWGAFWCPNCANQKKMFGKSSSLLPYVECSTPDGGSQTEECAQAGIEGYPTWDFADGTRQVGVIEIEKLAELSSCPLPEEN